MGPLIVLYELSILLALWLDRVRPPASRWDFDDDDELDDDEDAVVGVTEADGTRRDRPEE
jgi:hypothetical protein